MAVRLVGEGGVEWEFDLPLHETIADQYASGKLTAADEDSAQQLEAFNASAAAADDEGNGSEGELNLAKMKMPELLEHAKQLGVDEDTLVTLRKKADVIDAIEAFNASAAAADDDEDGAGA